jgi:hypothetical protein
MTQSTTIALPYLVHLIQSIIMCSYLANLAKILSSSELPGNLLQYKINKQKPKTIVHSKC